MKKFLLIISLLLFMPRLNALEIESPSAILMEAETGSVLYEKDADTPLAMASMTKIMTMLIIMEKLEEESISLEDKVLISSNAASMGGSQIYLEAGSYMSVNELLTSIAVGSANDASVAMAEYISGSEEEFVKLMNEKAKALNLNNTVYKNSHGLDSEGHYSTARDMATLSRELLKHENIIKLTSTYETNITHPNGKSIWLVNTNSLLRFYNGLDGLKTGFTDNALYCLTATKESEGMRLISVVMHSPSKEVRSKDTVNLLEYGFNNYTKKTLFNKEKSLGKVFIENAKNKEVNYYLKDNVSLVLPKSTKEINYNYEIKLNDIYAPLDNKSIIGKFIVNYEDKTLEYDLVVNEKIDKANYFDRLITIIKYFLSGNRY